MSRTYKFSNPGGLYFITFATVNWVDVFTRRVYKDILVESLSFCCREKGLELYAYVIMTNHIHIIARAKEDANLSDIVRDFKKYTSKQILKAIDDNPQESRNDWMLRIFNSAGKFNGNNKNYQFWQQNNQPIELFTNEVIDQKLNYIHNNPVAEGIVINPEDYLYSSARNYAEMDSLLDVDIIS